MRLIVGLLLALSASHAAAWSSEGHKLICQLAVDAMSDRAKAYVKETLALGKELDGNGENDFAEACLWPDKARFNDYKGSYEEHFINIPRAADSINFARDCAAMDCIAVGIQRNLTYLARPAGGSREEARKAAALRFVGHYIGDLHQPLHVSNGEDWGGNKIRVTWFGKETNLHSVWDRGILETANIRYPASLPMLAAIKREQGSDNVLSWMKESFRLARSHAYPNINGGPVKDGDALGEAYFERAKPIAIEQIAIAAMRLTRVIEGIADGSLDTNILIE